MNWEQITLVVFAVAMLCMGGYIKKLIKEIKDLVDCISLALQDGKITRKELADIVKEGKDVKKVIVDIIQLIARKP